MRNSASLENSTQCDQKWFHFGLTFTSLLQRVPSQKLVFGPCSALWLYALEGVIYDEKGTNKKKKASCFALTREPGASQEVEPA